MGSHRTAVSIVASVFLLLHLRFAAAFVAMPAFPAAVAASRRSSIRFHTLQRAFATASSANRLVTRQVISTSVDSSKWQVLLKPVDNLKRVGPVTSDLLRKLGISRVGDLLLHFPTDVVDRSTIRQLNQLQDGDIATVIVKVVRATQFPAGTRIFCQDSNGDSMSVMYFRPKHVWQAQMWAMNKKRMEEFEVGSERIVSGRAKWNPRTREWEMVQPDIVAPVEESDNVLTLQPKYSLTQDLTHGKLRDAIEQALDATEGLDEWFDPSHYASHDFFKARPWMSFSEAVQRVHCPVDVSDIHPSSPARVRLAFDELLITHLHLLRGADAKSVTVNTSSIAKPQQSYAVPINQTKQSPVTRVIDTLPFKLTNSQTEALRDICTDISLEKRMVRLLQGDVGCGKTIVALLAMIGVADAGKQAALLAPTEILAQQHYDTLTKYVQVLGKDAPQIGLLTGSVKRATREQLYEDLASGSLKLVVGTHALLAEGVEFAELGLAVVDEEQRFGVQQRNTLTGGSNVLLMTATPIPRSLVLTIHGTVNITEMKEKPAVARPVKTTLMRKSAVNKIIERLPGQAEKKTKIFWVVPAIEASRENITSAAERFESIQRVLGDGVALIHGRMSFEEKSNVMSRFADPNSNVSVLVATSVIEVGIDVPHASICVIENAEMFGLSQLHQLRGRIGRGAGTGNCDCLLLFDDSNPESQAQYQARLQTLVDNNDGFAIADADLRFRGPGDVLGTRQSGDSKFRGIHLTHHMELIPVAMKLAERMHELVGVEDGRTVLHHVYLSTESLTSDKRTTTRTRSVSVEVAEVQQYLDMCNDDHVSIIVDVEATGLDTRYVRVFQLAAKVHGGAETFNAFVNPGVPIPADVVQITGVDEEMLRKSGQSFRGAWEKFREWVAKVSGGKQVVLMAHNGRTYDFRVLANEVQRHCPIDEDAGPANSLSLPGLVCCVDTLQVLRDKTIWSAAALPNVDGGAAKDSPQVAAPERFNQQHLYTHLFGESPTGAHNALTDVEHLDAILSVPFIRDRWRAVANSRQFLS